MNHDILDYTLSTLHVSSGFVLHGFENWRVKRVKAPAYPASYFSLRVSFGYICETVDHVVVCLLAQVVGKLWGLLTGSQPLDSSAFHFGEWWQPRCSQTQVRLSCARLQTEAWSGTVHREKARWLWWQWVRRDKDRARQSEHRRRGMALFICWRSSAHSHEYHSHRGWGRNSSIHELR